MEQALMNAILGQSTQPKLPETKTKSAYDIGIERNSQIIIIKHNNTKGYVHLLDNQQELTRDDALNFVKTLRSIPSDKTLEIILHTPGGSVAAAEIIINAMLNHQGKICVYIPYYASSAGTLIALAADEIYLEKNAHMGPIDPQFRCGFSAINIINYTKTINNSYPSWVGDLAKLVRSDAQLSIHWIEELIERIASVKKRGCCDDLLFSGKTSHDRPLFYKDLCEVLTFIHEGVPDELYNLIDFGK